MSRCATLTIVILLDVPDAAAHLSGPLGRPRSARDRARAVAAGPARLEDGLGWGTPGAAERYAALALTWRDAGASILGSGCGTGPGHIASLRVALDTRL
jgi:hypothetical protein